MPLKVRPLACLILGEYHFCQEETLDLLVKKTRIVFRRPVMATRFVFIDCRARALLLDLSIELCHFSCSFPVR